MDISAAGIIAAIAMIALLLKMDMRKVLGYDVFIDIAFTALLAWMLAGTFSGMMSALLGGAILSIYLTVSKKVLGCKKLRWVNGRPRWVFYPP